MSSIIQRLFDRLYPRNRGHTVTIVGLDYSGKTTLLYTLKLGEIVQTIPSIGFNVEEFDVPKPFGRGAPSKFTCWDIGTGCGITYIYGLIKIYILNGDALIWMVDATDRGRLTESVQALGHILPSLDKDGDASNAKAQNMPILILVSKSDKPEATLAVDEVRIAFSKVTSGRLVSVFKTALNAYTCQNLGSSGLPEAFDWLSIALDIVESGKPADPILLEKPHTDAQLNQREQSGLAHKLESWMSREEKDIPADEFLKKFKSFDLPNWDHYTHIRIAYVILTRFGRREGKDMLFKGLQEYITTSPQAKGRSFHISMTYFWIQIVHLGIRNMPPAYLPQQPIQTAESSTAASPDDFARFLLVNPHVVDGNLWSDYYSKDVMMSPKAKGEMVLPDKKPLPNLVTRDAITTFGAKEK